MDAPWIGIALVGLAGVLFLALATLNAWVMIVLPFRLPAEAPRPSMVPLVGGVLGALACAYAPWPAIRPWFWLPLLLDVGTGPFLLLIGFAMLREGRERPPPDATAPPPLARALIGCLLGTAVGDALGLPMEGLSRTRQQCLFPNLDGPRLLWRYGLCSDDTEHTVLLAQALIDVAPPVGTEQVRRFARALAWRLRFWLLGLPAGIGLATLRGIVRLWIGFSPDQSGVYSAGNGPAMRSALLGVCFGDDPVRLAAYVRAATRLTHRDPRAEQAAYAVALAAHCAAQGRLGDAAGWLADLRAAWPTGAEDTLAVLASAVDSAARGESTATFADRIGCASGVSGYVLHSVPVALHAAFRHSADYRAAVLAAVGCGGDTDTVAAITGAVVGAGSGQDGIPAPWLARLIEWPRSVTWMIQLGDALARAQAGLPHGRYGVSGFALLLRNAVFIVVVLAHGLRRLLPPYG